MFLRENKSKVEDVVKTTVSQGILNPLESASIDTPEKIAADISKINMDIIRLQSQGHLEKVAELKYGKLPELEKKLLHANTPLVTKYYKVLQEHIFAEDESKKK